MSDPQYCACGIRRKVRFAAFVMSEAACGIPDSRLIDFMVFDEQGHKTVLMAQFCAWCGHRIDPAETREVTPPLGELLKVVHDSGMRLGLAGISPDPSPPAIPSTGFPPGLREPPVAAPEEPIAPYEHPFSFNEDGSVRFPDDDIDDPYPGFEPPIDFDTIPDPE